ncbi:hypothetical protein FJ976_01640 [Mesorhizobium sp. B1-1-9]|uniref:hypothetical protein n=1 Tax=Mesorhizobium sp. B1-1-9 TaxID=2589975 RepID=UPI00112B5A99|nr:hypothetical protein [Mesorhizobium sp. B1-1-9]TPN58638.1 hypothetical protein FJ976_01640 [Mesorhizobium sp. B1-1-9]
MSREFSKISPKVWRSKRFRALPTDDARFLLMFLLTSEHQTSAGCFRMPDAYAAADLGWPSDRMQAARKYLVEGGLLAFDTLTDEYFVVGWFGHNKPMNASHQKSIVRVVANIESDAVREAAEAELQPSLIPSSVETLGATRLGSTSYMNRRAS